MSDDHDLAPAPQASSMTVLMRKLLLTVAVLLVVWLVFGQIAPRYFLPRSAPPEGNVTAAGNPENLALKDMQNLLKEKEAVLAALSERVGTLEARLKTMEELVTAAPPPPPPPHPAPLLPDDMAPPPPPPEEDDRLSRLEAKIEEQEEALKAARALASRQISVTETLQILKEAVEQGRPFAGPLARLKSLSGENTEAGALLAGLAPHAERGVPTLDTLERDFEFAIAEALTPDEPSLKDNLRSLVRIRKVGDQPGGDDQSIIARAEMKLAAGDIEATVKELAGLSPAAGPAFSGWISQAEAHVSARRAAAALSTALAPVEPLPAAE